MTEVVITGFDVFTPLGVDAPSTWEAMFAGRSSMHTLPYDWAKPPSVTSAAKAASDPNEKLDRVAVHRLDRSSQFAMVASQEAWEDAGLGLGENNSTDPDRLAMYAGTGIGGLHPLLGNWDIQKEKGLHWVSPFAIPMLMVSAPAANLGLKFGATVSAHMPVSAYASSNEAIPLGLDQIRLDRCDIVAVGRSEGVIHPSPINAFVQMQALSRRSDDPECASCPWDIGRDGFVLGESPVVMVIETLEYIRTRGARICRTLAGTEVSNDNHDMVQPEPTSRGQPTTMCKALQALGFQPGDIKYINAHDTSVPQGGFTEVSSIATTLGPAVDECIVTSTKSMSDHLLDSTGALETFVTIMTLRDRIMPSTINIENLEPGLPVDIAVNEPRQLPEDDPAALNSSFGLGGSNVAVIVTNINITD